MAGISAPKPSRNRIFVIRHGERSSTEIRILQTDAVKHMAPHMPIIVTHKYLMLLTKTILSADTKCRVVANVTDHAAFIPGPVHSFKTEQRMNFTVTSSLRDSESNVQSVLVSDPKDGVNSYGLTDRGRQQAKEAAAKLKTLLESEASLKDRLMIISSDFKRARETAEILHENLQPKTPICFETALRERGFGVLHLAHDCGPKIQEIYDKEILDATQSPYGAECIMDIVIRMSRLVQKLEEDNHGKIIVLVSHADPLQILTAPLFGVAPNEHSKYLPWFDNCDIRELKDMTV